MRGYIEGGGDAAREPRLVGAGAAKSQGVWDVLVDGPSGNGVVGVQGRWDVDADAEPEAEDVDQRGLSGMGRYPGSVNDVIRTRGKLTRHSPTSDTRSRDLQLESRPP